MTELAMFNPESNSPSISGRVLHNQLEVKTAYTTWFDRMCEYGLVENQDFTTDSKNVIRADGALMPQTQIDHALTIEAAKEICMLQRTDKGRAVRRYLIELESKWNTPEVVISRALMMANTRMEELSQQLSSATLQLEEQKPLVQAAEKLCEPATGSVSFEAFAKSLYDGYGLKYGRNALIKKLREMNVLQKNNRPYQAYMNRGWFDVVEIPKNGGVYITTRLTGKGQIAIVTGKQIGRAHV